MKQTILKVSYQFMGRTYSNEFILFENDLLENLLPIDATIISVEFLTAIN
tara:strand:- start:70 stop:219 length:150 start_codon:yes stop_codon:yes gene_type:complete